MVYIIIINMLANSLRQAHIRRTMPLILHQRSFSSKSNEGITMKGGIINLGALVFVREKYACLVHRFQKYNRKMTPGLNFKIPFLETIEYVHDLREQVIEISSQVAVTKDNVALHIDGVLYIEIVDPEKASYNVENIY